MHRYKNIAVTGGKGAGKSTLALWLLGQLGEPYGGFQTVRYALTPAGPLYELREVLSGRSVPISELTGAGIRGIPAAFEDFGAAVLDRALTGEESILLLDEIGRFERTSEGFLSRIWKALDSKKTVIAVLKQEKLPHIETIKARRDTLLIDLDESSGEEARELLRNWMETL